MNAGRFVKSWVPVIVWMLVIFTASTDLMSSEHTSRFIGPFLRWLVPDISPASILAVQFFVRKMAHLTEYAVLGALLFRALRRTWIEPFGKTLAALALVAAASCAAADEFHQSFVATRTGSPYDVLIDSCGAAIGVLAFWWFTNRKARAVSKLRR